LAIFKCSACGQEQDTRCKPKKCSKCGVPDSFVKKA